MTYVQHAWILNIDKLKNFQIILLELKLRLILSLAKQNLQENIFKKKIDLCGKIDKPNVQ